MFNKNLLIDIFQAYYFQNIGEKRRLVFMSENLTNSGIKNSQDESEVRNGQGNALFAVLSGKKTVEVELTENVFDFSTVAMSVGSSIVAGAGIGLTSAIYPEIGEDKKIELPETLLKGEELVINDGDTTLKETTDYTITGKEITLTSKPKGTIQILPYRFETSEQTQTIVVESDKFATGGELWLKTIEKDEKENVVAYVWFVFDNVKPTGNFDISLKSEKQPTDMAVNMKVMQRKNSKELYRIVRQPVTH
ncbi:MULTISPECIES: hypothetical protein [unclassified Clostridium]|uniref:hypothetical protein n=1 Tax=unclassified Clostridium TaxID=2614128 RepID=UPI00207A28EE|nr:MULTISPECIES: hypothetical protein [unclassified Clostridium]